MRDDKRRPNKKKQKKKKTGYFSDEDSDDEPLNCHLDYQSPPKKKAAGCGGFSDEDRSSDSDEDRNADDEKTDDVFDDYDVSPRALGVDVETDVAARLRLSSKPPSPP